ncbi:MAG: hypothetical protein WAQ98_00010 [Blastocatellia bacterium]
MATVKRQNQQNKTRLTTTGFSLVELVIVLIITITLLSVVVYKIQANVLTFSANTVVSQLVNASFDARYHALLGKSDVAKRSFNVDKSIKNHSGITISTNAPIGVCEKTTSCPNQQTICVSGEPVCYLSANDMTFERFTGYLNNNYIIFVSSENRKLGLILYESGSYNVIENIAGEWKYRSDLKDLFIQQKEQIKQ